MTTTQLVQFYAPFAGLFVFWLGALGNRVATPEREERDRKGMDKAGVGAGDRITRMETILEGVSTKLASLDRGLVAVSCCGAQSSRQRMDRP